MEIREMQRRAWQTAEDHGFHDGPGQSPMSDDVFGTKLALIHSEVSEALEAHRDPEHQRFSSWERADGKPEGVASELADIVIRVGDLAGVLGLDLQYAIEMKMKYNESRPLRHGGKRA